MIFVWNYIRRLRGSSVTRNCFFASVINCGSIVELYQSKRILRQFGITWSIPPPLLTPFNVNWGKWTINYQIEYNRLDWDQHDMYVLIKGNKCSLSQSLGQCVLEYLKWYVLISHRIIHYPDRKLFNKPISRPTHTDSANDAVSLLNIKVCS